MATTTSTARDAAVHHLEQALATGIKGAARQAVKTALDVTKRSGDRELRNLDCDRLQPGKRVTDPACPGLMLRATKTRKFWVYRWLDKSKGHQVETPLGDYLSAEADRIDEGQLTITQAREKWRPLRQARKESGALPTAAVASANVPTVEALVRMYLSEYAEVHKKPSSAKGDARLLNRFIVPSHGSMRADQFRRSHLSAILGQLREQGLKREPQKVKAVVSAMYNVACGRNSKMEFLGDKKTWLPPATENPADGISLARHEPVNFKPDARQVRAYAMALEGLKHGAMLRFQMLTTTRIGEAAGASWSEIDLDEGVWTIPAERTKNSTEHRVMLSTQALDVLRAQKAASGSEWVFPRPNDDEQAVRADAATRELAGVREAAGINPLFTPHAVRAACLTWMAEKQESRALRDRVSNHLTGDTAGIERHYVAAQLDQPARVAWQKWADHIDRLVDDERSVVTTIRSEAAV